MVPVSGPPGQMVRSARRSPEPREGTTQPTVPPHSFASRLWVAGTDYRRSPIDAREALARRFSAPRVQHAIERLEALSLVTCNRCEVYAFLPGPSAAERMLAALTDGDGTPPRAAFYDFRGHDAVRHLVRLAAGLDSMAWGEPQIAMQLRAATKVARTKGRGGAILPHLVDRALAAAERVRRSAGISGAHDSLAGAVLRWIHATYPGVAPRALVVGLGNMGRHIALRLAQEAHLSVSDRDEAKAREIARSVHGRAIPFAEVFARFAEVDVAIVATAAARPLLTRDGVHSPDGRRRRRVRIVDLSVPRNVDPAVGKIPGVELVDVDGLLPWVERPENASVVTAAETAAAHEAARVSRWLRSREVDGTVAVLRRAADRVRREEVRSALARLPSATEWDRFVLEKMAHRIVNRVLHEPTTELRRRAAEGRAATYERAVRDLFRIREDSP